MPRYGSARVEWPKLTDQELARSVGPLTPGEIDKLKDDVVRLRWAADQMDVVMVRLEKVNDEALRYEYADALESLAAKMRAAAAEKVAEVRRSILLRRGEDPDKDVTRGGGRYQGGKAGARGHDVL